MTKESKLLKAMNVSVVNVPMVMALGRFALDVAHLVARLRSQGSIPAGEHELHQALLGESTDPKIQWFTLTRSEQIPRILLCALCFGPRNGSKEQLIDARAD